MSKNQVQFQTGYSLPELFANYGTEEQCRQSLFEWKWSEGFVCIVPASMLAGTIRMSWFYIIVDKPHRLVEENGLFPEYGFN